MEARLRDVEAALVRGTLEASDWNQSAAARRLGITETKVRNRMHQYGIRRPGETGGAS
jgi:DNA-binding NtrC family response regulator